MGWKKIYFYGYPVYVQRVSMFYKLKKCFEDLAVKKIKQGYLWS